MKPSELKSTGWYQELLKEVSLELEKLTECQHDLRPALGQEHQRLQSQMAGWSQTLAKPDLAPALRAEVESNWNEALERQREIDVQLAGLNARQATTREVCDPEQILSRLDRLDQVLASQNPTQGNLELSLHIDRIDCFADGKVAVRTCKLGALSGAADLLASDHQETSMNGDHVEEGNVKRSVVRRRRRLRFDPATDPTEDMKAAAYLAADPDRFAGLGEQWFWQDHFQIPVRTPSWVARNSEVVFLRRQESKLSYSQLAAEFGVSRPTIAAAVRWHLGQHPNARDSVKLPAGGKRPAKIDIASFAVEARTLFEADWPKEKLAQKFGCSPPTIDKALDHAYRLDGRHLPSRAERQAEQAALARSLFDESNSLMEVARKMGVTDVTARKHIKAGFKATGETMPDLRRRSSRTTSPRVVD